MTIVIFKNSGGLNKGIVIEFDPEYFIEKTITTIVNITNFNTIIQENGQLKTTSTE